MAAPHGCLLIVLLLIQCTAAMQSSVTVSAGTRPDEVSWIMMCSGGSVLGGGSPFLGSSNATIGENCALHMRDGAGDGWNGARWTALGQNVTLESGGSRTMQFVVPSDLSVDVVSEIGNGQGQENCTDMHHYETLQAQLHDYPTIKTCAAAAKQGLCSRVVSLCPASCGNCGHDHHSKLENEAELSPSSRRQLQDRCENVCTYPADGYCDDGGVGSQYADCDLGTDCDDCGSRSGFPGNPPSPPLMPAPPLMPPAPPTLPPLPPPPLCVDTCIYPADGFCDDGGPGFVYADCDFGSDCTDCGSRAQSPMSPPGPPGMPPAPLQPPM